MFMPVAKGSPICRSAMVILVAGLLTGSATELFAQEPTEDAKKFCTTTTKMYADIIVRYQGRGGNPLMLNDKPSTSWSSQVGNYMLQAAAGGSLTESELRTIGYTYCIQRRPSGM